MPSSAFTTSPRLNDLPPTKSRGFVPARVAVIFKLVTQALNALLGSGGPSATGGVLAATGGVATGGGVAATGAGTAGLVAREGAGGGSAALDAFVDAATVAGSLSSSSSFAVAASS